MLAGAIFLQDFQDVAEKFARAVALLKATPGVMSSHLRRKVGSLSS